MFRVRIFGVAGLLLLALGCHAATALSSYQLPNARFQDWAVMSNTCSDAAINQIWRKALTGTPKGADGYLLVSYQVSTADSAAAAQLAAGKLLEREQFSNYAGRGYTITTDTWPIGGQHEVMFTLRGLSQSTTEVRAQCAHIYTLALARNSYVIWLQIREASTATEFNLTDRTLKNAGARAIADEIATYLLTQWLPSTPAATDIPAPLAPTPDPQATIPAPKPAPDVTTPADTKLPTVAPPADDAPRWKTKDAHLSLVLPGGWHVSNKTPYRMTGDAGITITLYPSDPYTTDNARDNALRSAVAAQRDIALAAFTQASFTIDEAIGATVQYTNYAHNTVVCDFFAKSGRFWRLDINLPGEGQTLPATISRMIASIRVQ